jgi:hypothetical protein
LEGSLLEIVVDSTITKTTMIDRKICGAETSRPLAIGRKVGGVFIYNPSLFPFPFYILFIPSLREGQIYKSAVMSFHLSSMLSKDATACVAVETDGAVRSKDFLY